MAYLDEAGLEALWGDVEELVDGVTISDGGVTTAKLADGAVTDEKLAQSGGVLERVDDLKNATSEVIDYVTEYREIELTIENGYYTTTAHAVTFHEDNSRQSAIVNVNAGENYKISCSQSSPFIHGIIELADDYVTNELLQGKGSFVDYVDYEFIIPNNCNKIIICSAYPNRVQLKLKKYGTYYESKVYTKDEVYTKNDVYTKSEVYNKNEIDEISITSASIKKYGIKWSTTDANDEGSRCFDAVGLSATIGVGSTNGSSDFDNIYPWSGIKRCNIKINANGAKIVTYEGESGFALDGTNGDVFVKIPRFCVERYIDNGYEYRVISANDGQIHEAFVEDGKILDDIFVGAFEAYSDGSKLHSISGVIPTSNLVASDFLTLATANGDGYTLYDMRTSEAIWLLMAIEYGKRNSNRILGYGFSDFCQPDSNANLLIREAATNTNIVKVNETAIVRELMPIGSNITICDGTQQNIIAQRTITAINEAGGTYAEFTFDGEPIDVTLDCFIGSAGCTTNFCQSVSNGALSWHTGRTTWQTGNGTYTRNPIRYRWIENIFGSIWAFFPDVTFDNLQMYVCKSIKKYQFFKHDGTDYVPIGMTYMENAVNGVKGDVANSNYWVTKLSNETFAKFNDFGRAYDKSLTSTKAFGAYYYLYTGTVCIANGGGFDHLYRSNILTNRGWIRTQSRWYLYGARLMYKNLT